MPSNKIQVTLKGKDQLSTVMNKVTKGPMASMKKAALGLGSALVAAFAVKKVGDFLVDSVRVAAESEKIWTNLATSVNNTGASFVDMEDDIRSMAAEMQRTTTMGDEDFAEMFTRINNISGDVEKSMLSVGLAQDIMAATGRGTTEVAEKLGKVLAGEVASLKDWGIEATDADDAMKKLQERFGGFSANEAKTLGGRITQLTNTWEDFKQVIGEVISDMIDLPKLVSDINVKLQKFSTWIANNKEEIIDWGRVIGSVFKAIGVTLFSIFKIAFNVGEMIGDALRIIWNGLKLEIMQGINIILSGVNLVIEGLNKLPGIQIDYRATLLDTGKTLEAGAQAVNDLVDDWNDVKDAVNATGQAIADVIIKTEMVGTRGSVGGGSTTAGKGTLTPQQQIRNKLASFGPIEETTLGQGRFFSGVEQIDEAGLSLSLASQAFFDNLEAERLRMDEAFDGMRETVQSGIATTFGDAVYNGFYAAFSGEGISGLLKNFGKTVLSGLGSIFSQMGKQMILASGIFTAIGAAMTNPFTAGPALALFGAALVALGAAMGAIAQGRGGAGGRGGPNTRTSLAGLPGIGGIPQPVTVINVQGSSVFFDLNDPIQSANFASMFQGVHDRRQVIIRQVG